MKTIDRLSKYLDINEISPTVFERTCDISNGYFARQLRNHGSIGSDILEKISKAYPDLNLVWLITGKGAMIEKPPQTTKQEEESNQILEEEQAVYKKATEMLDGVKKIMDDIRDKKKKLKEKSSRQKKG